MKNLNLELDKVLDLLKKNDLDITENVEELTSSIKQIEKQIEKDTESSYTEIKDALKALETNIIDTTYKIDNLDVTKEAEKFRLKANHYYILTSMKNEIMNFDVENIDSLLEAFDNYNNEKKKIFNSLSEFLEKTEDTSSFAYFESARLIVSSLNEYNDILLKYQTLLSGSFKDIEEKIIKLSSAYITLYDAYKDGVREIIDDYEVNKDLLLSRFTPIRDIIDEDIMKQKANIDKDYIGILNDLADDYNANQENNFDEFKKESEALVNRFEKMISTILDSPDVFNDNEKAQKDLMDKIKGESGLNDDLVFSLENVSDLDSLKDKVTDLYKSMNEDTYNKYLEKEKETEAEYLDKSTKIKGERLFLYYLSTASKDNALIENEVYKEGFYDELDKLYKKQIDDRINLLNEYTVNQVKLLSVTDSIKAAYKYEKTLVSCYLKDEIRGHILDLKRQLEIIKEQNDYNNNVSKYNYNFLRGEGEKTLALLNYEIAATKLHRNYITGKAIIKLTYDLHNNEKEMSLVDSRFDLDQLVSEYELSINAFETLYKAEVNMLEVTRERNKLMDLSNDKYLFSYIKHRTLVAMEMIDMAKNEFELRCKVFKGISDSHSGYMNHELDRIIGDYMDDIDELTRIREIELGTIAQRMELKEKGSAEEKFNDTEEMNEILDKYQVATNKINVLLTKNREIVNHKEDIENINDVLLNSLDLSESIRNESLESAARQLDNTEKHLHAILDTLELDNINYKNAFDNYLLDLVEQKARLYVRLDKDSKPSLDKIHEIDLQYRTMFYKEEYDKLDDKHVELLNQYYQNLIAEYKAIDEKYNLDPNFEDKAKEDLVNKVTEITNNYKELASTSDTDFSKLLLDMRADYEKVLSNSLIELDNKLQKVSNELMKDCKQNLDLINDVIKARKKNIKILSKFLKKERKNYSFEFEAFKDATDALIDANKQKLENKYNKPTVYTLQGKENQ